MGMNPGQLWAALAGGGEFFGGILIFLGILTRFGSFTIAIVMLVAMLKVHWGSSFLPNVIGQGGIEYALALFCCAVSLMISGGGRFSVDAAIQRS